jgi:uncharacterized protein YwgA
MKRLAKAAVLMTLTEGLENAGSWCGETHIQKATFVLQEAVGVPLEYDFVLYKHGPFSFDLRDELQSFQGDGLIELRPQNYPYGPRLHPTSQGVSLRERFPKTLARYSQQVAQVVEFVRDRNVASLERLATALLLINQDPRVPNGEVVERLRKVKPHVSEDAASVAVDEVRGFLAGLTPAP